MKNFYLRVFTISFNCFTIICAAWAFKLYLPKSLRKFQEYNASGKLLIVTLFLSFLAQIFSLPSLTYRCINNIPFDIPHDAYIAVIFNSLNAFFALTADLALVFTSIYRIETMQLVFELSPRVKKVLLIVKITLPVFIAAAIVGTCWLEFGVWRVWTPFVAVGICQVVDQILLVTMWYSTLQLLIKGSKEASEDRERSCIFKERQQHFQALKWKLTRYCIFFAFLTVIIGVLYLVSAVVPLLFLIYFEVESFIICLGAIHIIVSIKLIHMLREGLEENPKHGAPTSQVGIVSNSIFETRSILSSNNIQMGEAGTTKTEFASFQLDEMKTTPTHFNRPLSIVSREHLL